MMFFALRSRLQNEFTHSSLILQPRRPYLLWNSKFHHRVQNSPPLDLIPGHINTINAISSDFFNVSSSIISRLH
jgi:hypothetical protein